MKRTLLYSTILCVYLLTACVGIGPKGNFISIVKFKNDYSDNAIVFLESYDGSINNPNPYFMRDKIPVKLINGYLAYPEIRQNSTDGYHRQRAGGIHSSPAHPCGCGHRHTWPGTGAGSHGSRR